MSIPGMSLERWRQSMPDISQDGVAAICAVGRQLAMRIDRLIALMERPAVEVAPGAERLITATGLELLALSLASFPRDHANVVVTTSATPLSVNPLASWVAVAVANNDNAKKLYYGCGSVAVNAAPFVPPGEFMVLYVPPSETLYGIVDIANISVGVSNLIIPR